MDKQVILCADGTCDIGPELERRFDVHFYNYRIQLGGKSYVDKLEISSDEIFDAWRSKKIFPKTSAISPGDYSKFFTEWTEQGCEVVHINLGSGISAAHQNCLIAAGELGRVYPVDSCSLSSGSGLLVAKAGEMIESGMTAADIQSELLRLRQKVHASFVLDTLEFMAAGGRCNAVTVMGANLLRLKPQIRVSCDKAGGMSVGRKYRGPMERVLKEYVREQLEGQEGLDLSRLFITSAGAPKEHLDLVEEEVKRYQSFAAIHRTVASGTIACHCGPGTIGILFMER